MQNNSANSNDSALLHTILSTIKNFSENFSKRLDDMKSDIDKKIDTMKDDVHRRLDIHFESIADIETKNTESHEKLGGRVGELEQSTAVSKAQMKIIGFVAGGALSGCIALLIDLLSRSK